MDKPYKPLTRRQRIARQVATLSEITGKPLFMQTWSPGDGYTRYTIEQRDAVTTGTDHYSQSLTLGEMESALILALKVAEDVRQGYCSHPTLSPTIEERPERDAYRWCAVCGKRIN